MNFVAGSSPANSISGALFSDVHVDLSNNKEVVFPSTGPVDRMRFWGEGMSQTIEGYNAEMVLHFVDSTALAFSDESLSNILNPALFDSSSFGIQISTSPGVTTSGLNFSVDSVSVSAVPVPTAAWLFGSGLIGIIGLARRK